MRKGAVLRKTDTGRATTVSTSPTTSAGMMSAPSSWGGDQQAEQDEHADLGDPAEPLGEAPGGGPVRQLGVAEDQRGEIDGQEAGAVRERAARVGHGRDGHHGDRVEAGGGQRHVPQPVRAQQADGEADGGADGQLQGDLAEQQVPVVDRVGGGEGHDEDDDGGRR
ncbi:hypothetical protein GCM10020000_47300 [Streptomyces olivoverticillatus]